MVARRLKPEATIRFIFNLRMKFPHLFGGGQGGGCQPGMMEFNLVQDQCS